MNSTIQKEFQNIGLSDELINEMKLYYQPVFVEFIYDVLVFTDIHFMYDELSRIKNVNFLTLRDSCMISFVPKNMHVLDFGVLVGAYGICLRVGNMCASWIHKKLGLDGSVRISVGPWNTMKDAKYVVDAIKKVVG